jgi:hypothetical protein
MLMGQQPQAVLPSTQLVVSRAPIGQLEVLRPPISQLEVVRPSSSHVTTRPTTVTGQTLLVRASLAQPSRPSGLQTVRPALAGGPLVAPGTPSTSPVAAVAAATPNTGSVIFISDILPIHLTTDSTHKRICKCKFKFRYPVQIDVSINKRAYLKGRFISCFDFFHNGIFQICVICTVLFACHLYCNDVLCIYISRDSVLV